MRVQLIQPLYVACFFLSIVYSQWAIATPLQQSNDWVYVIDNINTTTLEEIRASSFDIAVIDYESNQGELTSQQITTLKDSGKIVLAYMSIGEAEDYRFYWDSSWTNSGSSDPDRPTWLGPTNPDWAGNYKVRYWDTDWQSIVLGTISGVNKSYLDRIIDQGFDGVYLDIVDAFEYWSDDQSEITRAQARIYMIDFIESIATHARTTRGKSGFLVFPQNGDAIVLDDNDQLDSIGQAYLATISGIGVEDVFYDETVKGPGQTGAELEFRTQVLKHYTDANNVVISVDYVWNNSSPTGTSNSARYNDYHELCLEQGYIPYAAVRDRGLNEVLPIAAQNGLNFHQPKANSPLFVDSASTAVETGTSTYPYKTIESALAHCTEGGNLNIRPGVYCETFIHDKAVTLSATSPTSSIGCAVPAESLANSSTPSGFQSRSPRNVR